MEELDDEHGSRLYLGNLEAAAGARAAVMHERRVFVAGADGRLLRITLGDGEIDACDAIGESGWDTRVLAAARGRVLAFEENGHLYGVDPESGAWERLDGDWSNVRAACEIAGELLVAAELLFVVDTEGGGWRQLGDE